MSLAQALAILGYRALHFPQDDVTRRQVTEYLANGSGPLRLSVLDRLDALTDSPVCATFEALDAAYPGSRFILTTRDKASWLDSCRTYWSSWVDSYLRARPHDPLPAYLIPIHAKIYGTATFDDERFATAYDEYHDRVRSHFANRSEDLLTLNIPAGEGWSSLCRFLELSVPKARFPKLNPTE
jgi:hypothetical protein